MIDISHLNLIQLAELKKQIDVEVVRRKETEKQNLRAEIQRLAAAAGLSVSEIMEGVEKKTRKVSASSGIAQFRNPADESQTWTGRGRKPQWVLDWTNAGKSIEDLRI